jgi:hypothetical protein
MDEIVNNLDKWDLFKFIGVIALIISSVISFIAYFIKDYFLNKWKSDQQKEIEKIKSLSEQNNLIINNLTDSLSKIYLSSNEKRISYLEKAWNGFLEIKKEAPTLIFLSHGILVKDELINLPKDKNPHILAEIKNFKPEAYLLFQNKISSDIEMIRPFIGERLWTIFSVYRAFFGRLTYLLQDGLKKGTIRYWKEDQNFINQILGLVIQPDEIKKLLENDFNAFQNVINFLEYKALNEISEQVSGKRMTEENVKQAIELSKLTKAESEKEK